MRSAADCQNINAFYERDLLLPPAVGGDDGEPHAGAGSQANHRPSFRVRRRPNRAHAKGPVD